MSITSFSELGLDVDDVKDTLDDLGIDYSDYTDAELESLSLVTNLVLLEGINDKTTEIEEELALYQMAVDISSGMQDTLNDVRDYLSPSKADVGDVMTFLSAEQTYFDIDDASVIELDYTYDGTTYETLQDLFDALDDGSLIQDWYDSEISGNPGYTFNTGQSAFNLSDFMSDSQQIFEYTTIDVSASSYGGVYIGYDYDAVCDYFIAQAMQEAGYLNDDVYTDLLAFAPADQDFTNRPTTGLATSVIENYLEFVRLYFGGLTMDKDLSDGTLGMDMTGAAGMRQMGIDLGSYFDNDTSSSFETGPFASEDKNDLITLVYTYAYDKDFDDIENKDLSSNDYLEDADADTLLEAAATAIESQSNNTQIAQLEVNSAISEWGEFNDVWDMCHQYIHDALKRAEDNSV